MKLYKFTFKEKHTHYPDNEFEFEADNVEEARKEATAIANAHYFTHSHKLYELGEKVHFELPEQLTNLPQQRDVIK